MKKILFLAFFLTSIMNVFSQVNSEIKRHSQNNQEKKQENNSQNSSSSSNDANSYNSSGSSDACVDACGACITSGCLEIMGNVVGNMLEANREYVENKKDEVSYISHVDIAFQLGFLPNQYLVYLPRIRGQYGVFGTDFRVYHNREYRFKDIDPYTTYDWQILTLNLVSVKEANWRIGSGMMVENFDGQNTTFNEHTMALTIFPIKRISLNLEGRLTPDYQTNVIVRQEVNANLLYQINKSEQTKVNLMLGILSARYYQSVNVWTMSMGASITFQ